MTLRRYTARWSTPLSRSSPNGANSLLPWHKRAEGLLDALIAPHHLESKRNQGADEQGRRCSGHDPTRADAPLWPYWSRPATCARMLGSRPEHPERRRGLP
jgi:hypothetical protein